MPSPKSSTAAMTNKTTFHHWYSHTHLPPPRRRRYSSFVMNNLWNAGSNWDNALQGNSAGLLATMRTQVDSLKLMIDSSSLDATQKSLVQRLIAEVKQSLDGLNPAFLSQQVSRTSAPSTSMRRTASEQSAISSNAKAALGCMAYLQDDQLFPGCSATYQYVRERLEQIFRVMDGEYQVGDVEGVRQQQQALAPQQAAPMPLNPDGSMMAYTPPSAGTTALYTSQQPYAAQDQGYAPATVSPSASGTGQTPAPSPMAGLDVKPPSWNGTPNTTSEGEETVGSGQNWFSLYGTTLEKFAQRCLQWLQASRGDKSSLINHLRQNTVPENVIQQVLLYV